MELASSTADPANKIILKLMDNDLAFPCNAIFVLLTLYLILCSYKGNQTLGFRFAHPFFYPMR